MALPARKITFNEIAQSVPLLTPGEKETLEIMLQEDLFKEISERRKEFKKELAEMQTFSIEEVLKEINEG
ncbi:MAG: hypothetical protein K8T10_16710 [Candidatus Eremiobacteraeota bacterium]|nr:hypothetical protein [Candidatus Eremiobacteraeota bacterium]